MNMIARFSSVSIARISGLGEAISMAIINFDQKKIDSVNTRLKNIRRNGFSDIKERLEYEKRRLPVDISKNKKIYQDLCCISRDISAIEKDIKKIEKILSLAGSRYSEVEASMEKKVEILKYNSQVRTSKKRRKND